MSLLVNEEFALYQLRTSYLSNIKDGVGERLITVDSSVLNNPAFRSGGWTVNASDIKRTYSPPIPTAITSDYFQAPRSAGLSTPADFGDEEEEGGLVTGGGSTDTVGPSMNARRRRRREQLEEDDSSDLSDESEEENEETHRPVTQIKFQKMPVRNRAGSSPLRSSNLQDGPALMITAPSRPPESGFRRGSLGALEAVKERNRRDTITSSEMSSENEVDSSVFQRKQVRSHRPSKAAAAHLLSQRIAEDERENEAHLDEDDIGAESDGSSLSSGFADSVGSNSFLGHDGVDVSDSPLTAPTNPIPSAHINTSPRKARQQPALLQALPPPRPISMIQPVSALTLALKAKDKKPQSPFQRFAVLSGKGDPNPLWIKVFIPFSESIKVMEMPLRRSQDDGSKAITGDAIGLALFKYCEDGGEPAVSPDHMNVNHWVFRMYEDGEVEEDFPPITRNKPITDFTSNNNRPQRGRARDKPWDEFALVQATEDEAKSNEQVTPLYTKEAKEAQSGSSPNPVSGPGPPAQNVSGNPAVLASSAMPAPSTSVQTTIGVGVPSSRPFRNPVLGINFATSAKPQSLANPLDAPTTPVSHATPRKGVQTTVMVNFTDSELNTRRVKVDVLTDTYIADILEEVCHKLAVDKASFVLKVSGSATLAPLDRTVEALGEHTQLDLQRKRFMTDGNFGLSGSPGSSSPNAPILISNGIPKKGKAGGRLTTDVVHRLAYTQPIGTATSTYKRYYVTRKQPMPFSASSARILELDDDFMRLMPSESAGGGGKVTPIAFSSVIHSKVNKKHPRMFRVVVYKEREEKKYDFAAVSASEAKEIVQEINNKLNAGPF